MSFSHRVSWLVLIVLLVCLVPACYSEDVLRKVQTRPSPTRWEDVSGLLMTVGPNETAVDGKYYRTLELINSRLFVGGKDELFALNPKNLETLDSASIPCDPVGTSGNYIRVIQPLPNGELLECGTNCQEPSCRQRPIGNLSVMTTNFAFADDSDIVPFIYNQNSSSWFLTEDLEVFVGTNLKYFSGHQHPLAGPAIVKSLLQNDSSQNVVAIKKQLETRENEQYVLSTTVGPPHPQFVGDPISYNGRVYFFFRETAVEFVYESLVFSRVAVVCQNDTGGFDFTQLEPFNLVTFVKARLNCSISGTVPYYYNEIQDIYQSTDDTNVVFAVFATRAPVVASSAVCAYRLDEIEALFLDTDNKFTFQPKNGDIWRDRLTDVISPRLITCQNVTFNHSESSAILAAAQIMSASVENRLQYETSGSVQSNPLLVIDGERFSRIVVDENVVNSTDVMFIGTENESVIKAYLNADRSEAKVVEEINLDTNDHKTPVLTMVLSDSEQAVFVGTDVGVYKVPFQHCQDFTSRGQCLAIEDPYCSWDGSACVNSTEGDQDLDLGAENNPPPPSITIHLAPNDRKRYLQIPNHPLFVYVYAEAPEGQNIHVENDTVSCPPCASLPYTEYRAASNNREFLSVVINGSSSTETTNCSCTVVLAIDEGIKESRSFDLTVDTSTAVGPRATDQEIHEVEDFDNEIRRYKRQLQEWQENVGQSCGLDNVQVCQSP